MQRALKFAAIVAVYAIAFQIEVTKNPSIYPSFLQKHTVVYDWGSREGNIKRYR
jgi:hypothetical protein